ncbi:MAG: PHP domain-containing protein [Clostridia bacterium]|nr:PHP domain-containing protein [Clostridia bacterium]
MIQDLHSHTYYSFCGKDRPEEIVEAAIAGGVTLFGITDHAHGVGQARRCVYKYEGEALFEDYGRTLRRYFDHINLVREKYADRITVLRGIELRTATDVRRADFPLVNDISFFDYALIEQLDQPDISVAGGDLFGYAERCGCPVGIAHTDLFAFLEKRGEDPYRYFRRMAEAGLFWELNVSYDSIHQYREHAYVKRFFEDAEQQAIVRESGVSLSVGFDGHRVEDYRPDRVREACLRLEALGIPLALSQLAK